MIPVLFATTMAIPVSRNGTVNSAAACRWAFTFKAERAMSVRLEASSRMRPFQRPFWEKKHKAVEIIFKQPYSRDIDWLYTPLNCSIQMVKMIFCVQETVHFPIGKCGKNQLEFKIKFIIF